MNQNRRQYESTRRVVVTGLGIVSSVGHDKETVVRALRDGSSGMVFMPEMEELGYRCCVYAPIKGLDTNKIPRRKLRQMSTVATYAVLATLHALEDSGLDAEALEQQVDTTRSGIMVGTGGAGANEIPRVGLAKEAGERQARLGGMGIVRIMNSTASGNLAAHLGIKGRTCSISTACSTGLYNIGHAFELIRRGVQDLCICGSTEDDLWRQVGLSADNSDGMPRDYNDRPTEACRPFDRDRQGFVMSAGAGVLILEEYEQACKRGATIYAEVVGYGAANDGSDIFIPTGEGLRYSIEAAMTMAKQSGVQEIDYINTHGTGTPIGDRVEIEALKSLFGHGPMVSSTKGQCGHAQGATASQEAVYTLLMLERDFVAPTKNLENIAPDSEGVHHVRSLYEGPLRTVMTVNSGLGGTNACLILKKLSEDG